MSRRHESVPILFRIIRWNKWRIWRSWEIHLLKIQKCSKHMIQHLCRTAVVARALRPSSPNSLSARLTFVMVLLTRMASARACRVRTTHMAKWTAGLLPPCFSSLSLKTGNSMCHYFWRDTSTISWATMLAAILYMQVVSWVYQLKFQTPP